MSDLPPVPNIEELVNGSIRGLAQRYGVSTYRVRTWLYDRGLGKSPKHISWELLHKDQKDVIQKNFPRSQWRELVNRVSANYEHYSITRDTLAQYAYDRFEDYEEAYAGAREWAETANILGWYHGIVR
jgi:hypothetical protein